MMSSPHKMETVPFQQVDFSTILKKQFLYKVHAHYSMFSTMVILQLIGVIFAFGGENYGTGTENIMLNVKISSGSIVIGFTLFWIFIMAILMTTKQNKSMMHTFITNKKLNHLSNILFLLLLSVIGGISSYLIGFFIKTITFLWYSTENIIVVEKITFVEVILGIVVTTLYMFLLGAIGYFLGEIFALHRLFIIIIPVIFIGFLIIFHESALGPMFDFFTQESNFVIFTIKVFIVTSVLFLIASQIDRYSEVS